MNSNRTAPETPDTDTAVAPPPKLVEVHLMRRYCPYYLVRDNGVVEAQDSELETETIEPGVQSLHPEDASRILERGLGVATPNTFRDLR